jgi:transketolase
MRQEFARLLLSEMELNDKLFLLTGDLGYGLFDEIKAKFPKRFLNVGSCEQLMIGIAIGLYYENFIPICYSITPFLIYRPFELLRTYINHENIPIKLVGGGRDKDYLTLGFSHWAEDDIEILKPLQNIIIYKEESINKDLFDKFIYSDTPSYMNLRR